MWKKFPTSLRNGSQEKAVIQQLKNSAAKADEIYLASDHDREGEAIAWHLTHVLKKEIKDKPVHRIVFHEITKSAIQEAVNNPREIDMKLVEAQQARRILDRLVGFELSPLLWRKIKPALSAGRVQSVAVRLIVEREKEIKAFEAKSWYRVQAWFTLEDDGQSYELKAESPEKFATEAEARALLEECIGTTFTISNIAKKPGYKTHHPLLPLLHCNRKQAAASASRFPAQCALPKSSMKPDTSPTCVPIQFIFRNWL